MTDRELAGASTVLVAAMRRDPVCTLHTAMHFDRCQNDDQQTIINHHDHHCLPPNDCKPLTIVSFSIDHHLT